MQLPLRLRAILSCLLGLQHIPSYVLHHSASSWYMQHTIGVRLAWGVAADTTVPVCLCGLPLLFEICAEHEQCPAEHEHGTVPAHCRVCSRLCASENWRRGPCQGIPVTPRHQQHITMCEDGLHIRTRRHEINLHKA